MKTCNDGSEAELRNQYLNLATGDWILMIDADERIDYYFSTEIINELENCDENTYCYSVPVNSYYGNGKWAYFMTHRIFRNNSNIRYSGNKVHPTLRNSFYDNNYVPKYFSYPIHHLDALIKNRTVNKRSKYEKKYLKTEKFTVVLKIIID